MIGADLDRLLSSCFEAVVLVDQDTRRVSWANAAAAQLWQTEARLLTGTPVEQLLRSPEDALFWQSPSDCKDGIWSETHIEDARGVSKPVERRVKALSLMGFQGWMLCARDLSEVRGAEAQLERLVADLRSTLDSTVDGLLVLDQQAHIRQFNRCFAEQWSIPQELLTERDDARIWHWIKAQVRDREAFETAWALALEGPPTGEAWRFGLADGRLLELRATPQFGRGLRIGVVMSFRDVSEQVRQQEALKLAAKVFEASHDAIVIAEESGQVVAVNPSATLLTGLSAAAARGAWLRELLLDPEAGDFWPQVDARLARDGRWSGEVWHRRADGTATPIRLLVVRMMDLSGSHWHDVCFLRDLSERMADKRRIEELVLSDSLTGLPNRLLLARRFEQAMRGADAGGTGGFSVLFIDLDRFKHINDSMGHLFGDRVLLKVAKRLGRALGAGDTLARLGGDEFVVLLEGQTGQGAEPVAQQILADLSQPFEVDGLRFTLTASIGIARYPQDGRTADDLIKHADTAMYAVKELGRSGVRFYCSSMNADLLSRVKLDHAMRQALERGAFRLVYQPQVPLAGGAWVGVEALIRWHDPELGDVSPGQFIPVAEETGFIVEIGNWVLDEAARQAAAWRAAGLRVPVAVNVSALQFQQSDFVARVQAALARNGLPGEGLELELTESILVKDAQDALAKLHQLAGMGVKLSVDDFGTGYSSLAYLKRFPIHKLKIDRSFVQGLPRDEGDAAIVKAIVEMGHAMKLKVIAEGVELEEQRACLVALGCDEYQGFLFARPAGPEAWAGRWRMLAPGSAEGARQ